VESWREAGRMRRKGNVATLAVVAVLAMWGCTSDECARSSDCPLGQYCISGSCQPIGGDASDGDSVGDGREVLPETGDGLDGDAEDVEADGFTCTGSFRICGGECVDLTASNVHCGACDSPCAAGSSCAGGACRLDCSGSALSCAGECIDRLSDPDHCGSCEGVCVDPQVCAAGTCADACPTGTTSCGRGCADTQSSIDHCGACDQPCANLEWCVVGVCQESPCAFGDLFCDGSCVPNSEDHCGGCDTACDPGFTCCERLFEAGKICVDLTGDPQYCGSCTNLCPSAHNCVEGTCVPV
jgi:hypothetical protein